MLILFASFFLLTYIALCLRIGESDLVQILLSFPQGGEFFANQIYIKVLCMW
jgi:hypothetical protein